MEILKKSDIDWRERRLICILYMDQSAQVRLDRGVTKSAKTGRRVRKGRCLSPILLKLYK
jgi:hypothetical protein